MSQLLASLQRQVEHLRTEFQPVKKDLPLLRLLREDPTRVLSLVGLKPDLWQADVLRTGQTRILINCSRQSGKSTVAAGMSILTALLEPPALSLLLAPAQRQSEELFRK